MRKKTFKIKCKEQWKAMSYIYLHKKKKNR